jgi:hypothetical protein
MAATLTDISIKTRKTVRYFIYFIIFYFVARFLLTTSVKLYKRLFPKGPPPPTVGFDRLPAINFPAVTETLPQMDYKLEIASGALPDLPTQIKVYYMPKPTAKLSSFDESRAKAQALGFTSEPIQVTPTLYRFNNPQTPNTMEINIITGAFSTSFNLAADPSPLDALPPSPENAVSIAKDYLQSAGTMPGDLTGPATPEFLKVEGQNLVSALSLSDADLVKVNLFRKNFGVVLSEKNKSEITDPGYLSLPPNPKIGNIWLILAGKGTSQSSLIGSEFHYYSVDEEKFETYPLKSSSQAFEELKASKGYIANLGLNKEGKVTIRKVYLAYYDPNEPAQFFQPIIVFEGDNNFFAYVPAVTADYYGEGGE